MIVADPNSLVTMQILRTLKRVKYTTNAALADMNMNEASFLQKYYGMMAALASAGDNIFCAAGEAPAAGVGGLACAAVGSITAGYAASSASDSFIDYIFRD